MGFLEYLNLAQDAKRGISHAKHQMKYHPDQARESGFHLSNLSSIGQGIGSFIDGFTGGSEMDHDDRVDAAYQDKDGQWGQRDPGAAAYHYVT